MNLSRQLHAVLLLALALLSAAAVHAADDATTAASERPLVLASLAPLYELTRPLLINTPVELRLLPDSPRSMQSHHSLFVLQAERFAEDFRRADAVLSLASVWSEDPLYTTAREFNIRVVAIDAGSPWSHARDGVALANSPVDGHRLLPVWLSLSNAMR
ncbi:MAG TPA: metal ABC transporter substrate-binding protein, partial [Pseudomonadaceae bacterium]|nr:metal ABC transporter substrate-binding protein [Pseudomonadaceae bacterium]